MVSGERIPSFAHEYRSGAIHFGSGCVADIEDTLEKHGLERALIVCGRTVGSTDAVMEPVTAGIGDRLAGAVLGSDGVEAYDPTRFDGDEACTIESGMAIDERR